MAIKCWDFICPRRDKDLSFHDALFDLRDELQLPFFMEILILASWSLCIIRNNRIFRDERPTFERWKAIYLSELHWLKFRIKAKHADQFKA